MSKQKQYGRVCSECDNKEDYGITINYKSWCSVDCYLTYDKRIELQKERQQKAPKKSKKTKKSKKGSKSNLKNNKV